MSKKVGECTFRNRKCSVVEMYYGNARKALQLNDMETGEPYAIATVNLPNYPLPDENHAFIKTWSENMGIFQSLKDAGIISDPKGHVPTGYVEAPIVELLYDNDSEKS